MADAFFEEVKSYIGFDRLDAERLKSLQPLVAARIPAIVDAFYQVLLRHLPTAAILNAGEGHLERLRVMLSEWIDGLFCGSYGTDYVQRRSAIGRTHVRVGLPQHYMVAAMEVMWRELRRVILDLAPPNVGEAIESVHKILSLELASMLQSYRESDSEQVRELERKAVQEQLTRAEHLAHIGQLAASLAHEIKNPLAGISGAIQVIRDAMPSEHPHRAIVVEILRQIARLDGTVKDLLVYSRPMSPRLDHCDVQRMLERLTGTIPRQPDFQRVRVEFHVEGVLPLIQADENQIEQLLVNLLLNAAHATSEGGLVRLDASTRDARVRLVVRDTGCGMSEETARRAFEPFFTTKAKGTGLGLPICQRITEAHGGVIRLHSEPGRGTAVTVEFPAPPARGTRGSEHHAHSRLDR